MPHNLARLLRAGVGLAGIALALPLLGVLALAAATPLTRSGAAYLAAAVLIVGGLVGVLPWGARTLLVTLAGLLLASGVAGVRLWAAARVEGPLRVAVLPDGGGPRWVSRLVDEQDLLLVGEGLLRLMGGVSAREHAGLSSALTAGYAELRALGGTAASPVPGTYLFLQRPGAFDAVIVEPEGAAAPTAGVVFLHGFTGNVALQCWEIAKAARTLGMVTVCPSTGWIGDWWRPGGAATVQATLDYLRARGLERIYLGGFSNGGIGLSRLASDVAAQAGLQGLFFIAGVTNGQAIADTGLPVLILAATGDERMGTAGSAAAAAAVGPAATYAEVDGDHFLIVKESEAVREVLAGWLEER